MTKVLSAFLFKKNILPQFPHINKIKSDLSNQNFQVSNLSFPPLAQKFSWQILQVMIFGPNIPRRAW